MNEELIPIKGHFLMPVCAMWRVGTFRLLLLLVAALFYVPFADAQTSASPFLFRIEQGGSTITIPSGGTLNMQADGIGRPVTVRVALVYRGTSTATIRTLDVAGGSQFVLRGLPQLPLPLSPDQQLLFEITFTPTSSSSTAAQLTSSFTEGSQAGTLAINLLGTVPEFTLAYVLQNEQNVINVSAGGTILFPATAVNTSTVATVIVLNRGSAPIDLRAISLTGTGTEFQVLGLPLLPGLLDPNRDVRFTIRYSPRQSGTHSASLRVTIGNAAYTAEVVGSATGPLFLYELLSGTTSSPLKPNEPFALPDTLLTETRSFVVRVRNTGDGDGQITAINVLGPGFQLADLPFLPETLSPGGSLFFTLNFTPVQPGRVTGRLRIGNDSFEFSANALGPKLDFTFGVGAATVPVVPTGTINFSPIPIGERTNVEFTISNTGTRDAVIATIATTSSFEFGLTSLPALPVSIAPDSKITFLIGFRPNSAGLITSTLRVDNLVFTLSGTGRAAAALPGYRFLGAGGVQDPLQQIAIGLTLDTTYPSDLTGTLALTFNSDSFAIDPALQFVTGGRIVDFTIPANTTNAIFINNSQQIRLQTGSVAGTIVLTPSFTIANGGPTFSNPMPPLTLNVPSKPPVILSVDVANVTNTSFTLLVTGYSTSRSLTKIDFGISSRNGSLSVSQISQDISSVSATWYRSGPAQTFGSLFTMTIPFTFQGIPISNPPRLLAEFIQSVMVTISNELGNSNSVEAVIP
jgi:hypothetical protein